MAHTKLYGKDLKAYQDVDLDALLAKLTDAELEELHTELIDPDVCVNSMSVCLQDIPMISFCHVMLCISMAYAVMQCLSIRLSVMFMYCVEMNEHIFKIFFRIW